MTDKFLVLTNNNIVNLKSCKSIIDKALNDEDNNFLFFI